MITKRICRNYEQHSTCTYGANCRYLHVNLTGVVSNLFSQFIPPTSDNDSAATISTGETPSTTSFDALVEALTRTAPAVSTTTVQESTSSKPTRTKGSGIVVGTGKAQGNFKAGEKIRYINHKSNYVFNDPTRKGKVPKLLHIYLGQVNKTTKADDILKYLRRIFPSNDFQCEQLKVGKKNACFKITAPAHLEKQLFDGRTWPKHTFLRKYYLQNKKITTTVTLLNPYDLDDDNDDLENDNDGIDYDDLFEDPHYDYDGCLYDDDFYDGADIYDEYDVI